MICSLRVGARHVVRAACALIGFSAIAMALPGPLGAVGTSGLVPSFEAMTFSNTLLAASAALYVANVLYRSRAVGRLATLFAAAAAAGIAAALVLRGLETAGVATGAVARRSYLYEATALFAAGSVLIYLAMESVFRNRSAGAVVMPAIMVAVACELWLVWEGSLSVEEGLGGAGRYWRQAWMCALIISELALFAAAGAALLHMLRTALGALGAANARGVRMLPGHWAVFDVMFTSVAVGLPVHVLASALGVAAAWTHMYGVSILPSLAAILVVVIYVRLLHLVYFGRGRATKVAQYALLGCIASLLPIAASGCIGAPASGLGGPV